MEETDQQVKYPGICSADGTSSLRPGIHPAHPKWWQSGQWWSTYLIGHIEHNDRVAFRSVDVNIHDNDQVTLASPQLISPGGGGIYIYIIYVCWLDSEWSRMITLNDYRMI